MAYIRSLDDEPTEGGCFLCRYWREPRADAANHVIWRTRSTFVALNRFPYTNGHVLVAHAGHRAEMGDLADEELMDLTRTVRNAVGVLRSFLNPQGFNIGFNLGRCAGAGLPGHLHAHIVPRWSGDTNFMAVVGDARVIPDSLDALAVQLTESARVAGLRTQDAS
jgi:ATP adenylyltransferase